MDRLAYLLVATRHLLTGPDAWLPRQRGETKADTRKGKDPRSFGPGDQLWEVKVIVEGFGVLFFGTSRLLRW